MQSKSTIVVIVLIFHLITSDAIDCYSCKNCLNTERGTLVKAQSEEWCYKIIWRSDRNNKQIVSRGASADCRQNSYNDPTMIVRGIYMGTARYCCRTHLCNSSIELSPNRFLLLVVFFSLTI